MCGIGGIGRSHRVDDKKVVEGDKRVVCDGYCCESFSPENTPFTFSSSLSINMMGYGRRRLQVALVFYATVVILL
jgi:hypothetical protein